MTFRYVTVLVVGLLLPNDVFSQPVSKADATDSADRLELMKRSAAVYDFHLSEAQRAALTLRTEPVLRWNNPVSGVKDGTLFVWIGPTGRPEVAAQIFLNPRGTSWLDEFQSLSMGKFTAKISGRSVWFPQTSGVVWKPFPDTEEPHKMRPRRLAQMRAMARQFTASDDFQGESRWQLRLLTNPLYRYEKPKGDVLDGALFAFAHGTDPEVLLLLEARRAKTDYRWHYALAPMTAYAVKASIKGTSVWSQPRRSNDDPKRPYFLRAYRK